MNKREKNTYFIKGNIFLPSSTTIDKKHGFTHSFKIFYPIYFTLCCIFVLVFFILCTLCCKFLWIVHFDIL